MSIMNGGIMNSQHQGGGSSAGISTVATFAELPTASSQPNAMYRVGDINNAVLISDGANWSPLNGQAVIANAHNVNLTIQSLAEQLITAVVFPAGFVRAGSRLRTWSRWAVPGIGSGDREVSLHMGASGSGVTGGLANSFISLASGTACQLELMNMATVTQNIGNVRNSTAGTIGLHAALPLSGQFFPFVDFTVPWEIAFTGQSAAETAQTGVTATWAAGVATFTSTAHGYAVGDKIVNTTFAPAGYNGTLIVTGVTANTWTAAIAADPGGAGTGGTTSRVSNVTLVDYLIEWLQ